MVNFDRLKQYTTLFYGQSHGWSLVLADLRVYLRTLYPKFLNGFVQILRVAREASGVPTLPNPHDLATGRNPPELVCGTYSAGAECCRIILKRGLAMGRCELEVVFPSTPH